MGTLIIKVYFVNLRGFYKKESQGCIFPMTDRLIIFEFYDALFLLANS